MRPTELRIELAKPPSLQQDRHPGAGLEQEQERRTRAAAGEGERTARSTVGGRVSARVCVEKEKGKGRASSPIRNLVLPEEVPVRLRRLRHPLDSCPSCTSILGREPSLLAG